MTITRRQLAAHLKKAGSSIEEFENEVEKQGRLVWYVECCRRTIDLSLRWGDTKRGYEYWEYISRGQKVLSLPGVMCDSYYVLQEGNDLVIGCQTIIPKQQRAMFKLLAKKLGYEVEG